MKTRESGMPAEARWASFFDVPLILATLGVDEGVKSVVEFGCGYGTFTIPTARIVSATVYALDIEPGMIQATQAWAAAEGLTNVRVCLRDFVAQGTGLPDRSVDYVMLFNILHAECPTGLLREAYRVLVPGGKVGIIHWNYDPATPRGPSMDIRPRPGQCVRWAERVGFGLLAPGIIALPPYHYGVVLEKDARHADTPS